MEQTPPYCRLTSCSIDLLLGGAFWGLLPLLVGGKNAEGLTVEGQTFDSIDGFSVVAGVGFEPTTFRL